jgi:hypothetical protein
LATAVPDEFKPKLDVPMTRLFSVVTFLAAVPACPVSASIIVYTDEGSFLAASGNAEFHTESFESFQQGDIATPFSVPGFTLNVPNDTRATVVDQSSFVSDGTKSIGFPFRGSPTAELLFDSPIRFLAFDIIDALDTGGGSL